MVLPESQLVAAGAKYKAKMFISASAIRHHSNHEIERGKSIPVDSEGFGKVEFTAKADSYDKDGQQQKSFTAEIAIGDQVFQRDKYQYTVARPVYIQIHLSICTSIVYRNCGNELDVQVPALGAAYASLISV
jgi:hypothetical protein